MNNFNFDKYLNLVNAEKKKYGLDLYTPLYPMFRLQNNNLYIVVGLVNDEDNVWSNEAKVKPEYWVLIDINKDSVLEFNKTDEKDFVVGNVIDKVYSDNDRDMSKYVIQKILQYKEYFKEDFMKQQMPLQKKLADMLGDIIIDGEKVDLNEYVFANIEKDIEDKLNDLVRTLVWDKYGSIIFYYDMLFTQIIDSYKTRDVFDIKEIKLGAEIMNGYYPGVYYIDNLFNV